MKKNKSLYLGGRGFSLPGLLLSVLFLGYSFIVNLVPINIFAVEFWMVLLIAMVIYIGVCVLTIVKQQGGIIVGSDFRRLKAPIVVLVVLIGVFVLASLFGAVILHAHSYASILKVQDAEFTEDLPESAGTDSIALMDTASAKKLGDREIGSLANVVSQYNVSDEYVQIDYKGTPKKVAPLEYAGFFKWFNNHKDGVPGYVTVDPVSMSASYQQAEKGMVYVPSAYFFENAARHIWLSYPTTLFGNLHFEIDENGNPYYVASVYKKTISLFGGRTVSGAIVMNPVDGSMEKYALADVPTWVDEVYSGDIICEQYNWYGMYSNGYLNSVFSKKGCKQVTQYYGSSTDYNDQPPTSDYGFVAKDGDIWIYTGITSVNQDSSNIGFLLANERTGESHFFNISGADEKSAMSAAEGEVQEKGYQASFPSLINVKGNPTYIMVLKDSSGLVKLYAAVNVQQYNLVTTASSQADCLKKYANLLGIAESGEDIESIDESELEEDKTEEEEEILVAEDTVTLTISKIKYIDIDGNTYIYLIGEDDELYKAKAGIHEEMLLLEEGDSVELGVSGEMIVTCSEVTTEKTE